MFALVLIVLVLARLACVRDLNGKVTQDCKSCGCLSSKKFAGLDFSKHVDTGRRNRDGWVICDKCGSQLYKPE